MAYYSVIVREKKDGAKRRRQFATAAKTLAQAQVNIQELCRGTGFVPDYATVDEINSNRYCKIIGTLVGRQIKLPMIAL